MSDKFHGVDNKSDNNPALFHRETRSWRQRSSEFYAEYGPFMLVMFGLLIMIWPLIGLPLIYDMLCLVGLYLWRKTSKHRRTYNFRSPQGAIEGDKKPGIAFLGNEIGTGSGIFFSNDDLRTHMLVFGTTGSGKTRFLLGLLYQSLLMGSGCLYVDGKADNTVFWLVYTMCRRLGRTDDLLVINYLTGGERPTDGDLSLGRLSNTNNPFAYGTSESMRSMISGLMRESGGDGDMWKGRAIAMLGALLRTLEEMRNRGEIELDVEAIRDHMGLNAIFELSQRPDLPESAVTGLRKFLAELPGFNEEEAMMGRINGKAYEQHTYLTMQLTEVLGDLSETYGHIFKAKRGEVDFKDVVFNRRILFVMLPSLEKDPDALAGLGKLIVAGVRAALSPALGNSLEGHKREVIDSKPTNSNVPFLIILDEYGYYAVKGFSLVAAQARSLGIALVFAGQDFQSFEKASKEEARAIAANTNIKVAMKIEDEADTFQLIEKRAGQAEVTQTAGFEINGTSSSWSDQKQARIEKKNRVSLRDVVSQGQGEAHILFGDSLVRSKLCFIDPPEVQEAELNKFLMVGLPESGVLKSIEGTFNKLEQRRSGIESLSLLEASSTLDPDLAQLFDDFDLGLDHGEDCTQASIIALGSVEWRASAHDEQFDKLANITTGNEAYPSTATKPLVESNLPDQSHSDHGSAKEVLKVMSEVEADDSITSAMSEVQHQFTSVLTDSILASNVLPGASLIDKLKHDPREQLKAVEQRLGRSEAAAAAEADRVMNVFDQHVKYPSEPLPNKMTQNEITAHIAALRKRFQSQSGGDAQ